MDEGFNSRTPKGCDVKSLNAVEIGSVVSIHAPLKGATSPLSPLLSKVQGFNSRTPKGCDQHLRGYRGEPSGVSIHAPLKGATAFRMTTQAFSPVSIHAPLKGATPREGESRVCNMGFNSRTPKGCDGASGSRQREERVSIHAPLKGATLRQIC